MFLWKICIPDLLETYFYALHEIIFVWIAEQAFVLQCFLCLVTSNLHMIENSKFQLITSANRPRRNSWFATVYKPKKPALVVWSIFVLKWDRSLVFQCGEKYYVMHFSVAWLTLTFDVAQCHSFQLVRLGVQIMHPHLVIA